jgi:peptide/nickel transport system permease protein
LISTKPTWKNWRWKLGISILTGLYLIAAFAQFIGPYSYLEQVRGEPSAPASSIHIFDEQGVLHRPFIYPTKLVDPRLLTYEEIRTRSYRIGFLVSGSEYNLFGVFRTSVHLFGVAFDPGDSSAPRIRLLGSDQLGRDNFSRLLSGMRFSLLVTPAGALIALILGVLIGGISGYSRDAVDTALMGITDTVIALPALTLILAARAAFPLELSPTAAATMLVLIFGLTGWGEMARVVRGLVRSLRQREFVLAAKVSGSTEAGILIRHIMPNIAQPVLIQATLMLPAFLLTEVAMSFLGVGLQEPEPSLGNMLGAAADLIQIQQRPLGLVAPVVVIMLFLIGSRLVGRGRHRSHFT